MILWLRVWILLPLIPRVNSIKKSTVQFANNNKQLIDQSSNDSKCNLFESCCHLYWELIVTYFLISFEGLNLLSLILGVNSNKFFWSVCQWKWHSYWTIILWYWVWGFKAICHWFWEPIVTKNNSLPWQWKEHTHSAITSWLYVSGCQSTWH